MKPDPATLQNVTVLADDKDCVIQHNLPRRLQAGRSQPFGHVSGGVGLPRLAQKRLANCARWKQFGFLAQSFRLVGKTFFKGFDLLETASLLLHGAAPLLGWGGSATGRSHHR